MKTTTSCGLADRISRALATSPFVPPRKVMFEETAGTIVLKGQVDSFFQKQMAQEALRRVDGVQSIENLLEVSWA